MKHRSLTTSHRLFLPLNLFLLLVFSVSSTNAAIERSSAEQARWQQRARNVTITRDDWGIAHVVGKSDADAVFGAIYAQAEDDFNRIETNYLNAMGRLAEAEGESAIWKDLRMKIFIDPVDLKKYYAESPSWLRKLMDAWADGLNYYLATHPNVRPRVLTKFEPWMALSFTEGSIGGDIEEINLDLLQRMYNETPSNVAEVESPEEYQEPRGSNGIAIAPSNTVDKKALLLINPHTTFFFRSELHMTSGEGLNAYGASTWGQFFIYQGFNEYCGWMHTSSAVDAIDEYVETVLKKGDRYFYKFAEEERPVMETRIRVPYRTPTGMAERLITVYRTHHGPIVRQTSESGQWVSVALMNKPIEALTQSYMRTKAKNLKEYKQVMDQHANSSNNTIYADRDGNIAYFHANYIPRRDPKYDWRRPVNGSDPGTEYKGLLSFDESPNVINPATGWLYNSNNWPWSAAGPSSLKQSDFPPYVDNGTENARGLHAIKVLENRKDFTLEKLEASAYDSYLTWFEKPIPALVKAWDATTDSDALKTQTAEQIALLRKWNLRWGVDSISTSLAVFWGEEIQRNMPKEYFTSGMSAEEFIGTKMPREPMLRALVNATAKQTATFGKWRTPWGEINRFQRISNAIVHPFMDEAESIPVGFTSARWGSLASFGASSYRGSKKIYGTTGNSFVAVVEFGKTVRAKAVTAGGESGDPKSKHFNDQAERYATGNLREVYFYPAQLKGHTEKTYKPGE